MEQVNNMSKILVSACLGGYNCNYKGESNFQEDIYTLIKSGNCILVCPEALGGMTTPRNPSECISDEKVINNLGEDTTSFYFKGAAETLRIAELYNCKVAILKEKSPSCGTKRYDGTFSKRLIDKNGITAKLLADNDIRVISSDDHESIEKLINQIKNRNFK